MVGRSLQASLGLLAVLVAACAPASKPQGQATSTPSASPRSRATAATSPAPREPLFAVLEVHGAAQGPPDTVAIVGLDGYARAKRRFQPVSVPYMGNAATILLPGAQVAAGAVYFVDGTGTVRRLAPDGGVAVVTRFPLTNPQQEISFAVSPDGRSLEAAVLTAPVKTPPPSGIPFPGLSGPWKLDIETASAGASSRVVAHSEYRGPPIPGLEGGFQNVQLVGWDDQGPIALLGAAAAVQNDPYTSGHRWMGGRLVRLAGGRPGAPVGGAGCMPFSLAPRNAVICGRTLDYSGATGLSLREAGGRAIWSIGQGPGCFAASPDLRSMAMAGQVLRAGGASTAIPPGFCPLGWVSSTTMVGVTGGQNGAAVFQAQMAAVSLADPAQTDDLGFWGLYVGSL